MAKAPPSPSPRPFPPFPGTNYTLTFWQSDASNAAPSLSELTVSVAGLSRVFSRSNDTGYVCKHWHFTANDYCTTLQFTDTTPPGNPSPFLDAVSVNPGSVPYALTGTIIPGGASDFASFPGSASLSGSSGRLRGCGLLRQAGHLWLFWSPSPFKPWPFGHPVDLSTPVPSGSGTFSRLSPGAAVPSTRSRCLREPW